jgi:uncharacterized lipoprotein YddW (UPF0748 family)
VKQRLARFLNSAAVLALGVWGCGCDHSEPPKPSNGRPETMRPAGTPTTAPLPRAGGADVRQAVAATPPGNGRVQPRPIERPVRAVWVARFHYRYPDDVRTIIYNCAAMGFNTVLWQVRGEATVTYASAIEPWAEEFGYADPGFDPLALAVEEAHRYGLRIEAWVNVLPGWKGKDPPPVRNHIYYTHPEWFLYDAAGRRQPPGEFYVIVNPCLPEVREYIVRVCEETLTRYDVDGLHLDYVRYAWETTKNAKKRYPRDARTLELFRQATGKRPDDDPKRWDGWRIDQLTQLVTDMRRMVDERRPGATLTAAVKPDPNDALRGYFQNSVGWMRGGLLDAAYPMAYSEKLSRVQADVQAYRAAVGDVLIVPGIGIYMHRTAEAMRGQLERCRQWGGDFAVFSYDALLPTHQDRTPKKPGPGEQQMRVVRRGVLGEFNSQ